MQKKTLMDIAAASMPPIDNRRPHSASMRKVPEEKIPGETKLERRIRRAGLRALRRVAR